MAMLMLVIVLAGVVCKGEPTNRTLTLGYLLSWSHEWPAGPYIGSAIVVAIQEVHRRQLLPGYEINWILKDTWCQVRKSFDPCIHHLTRSSVGPGMALILATIVRLHVSVFTVSAWSEGSS